MSRACCLIRDLPHYRREAFVKGLQQAGFQVRGPIDDPRPEDVLVIWNRYGTGEAYARKFESARASVIVAENGYIGTDSGGRQYYALALEHHVGAGRWVAGRPGEGVRFPRLNVELHPWREDRPDGEIVILPQRGIGPAGVAMPTGWPDEALKRARGMTDRAVRIRPHPGANEPSIPLEVDLAKAHAAIIWASGAGVKALALGVPVFNDFPKWIMRSAARPFGTVTELETVNVNELERLMAFERLSWAQWTVDEIASGYPFLRLIEKA